jgi:hypothetical protein
VSAHALELAGRGFRVLPLDGKIPRTRNGFYDATTDADVITGWWRTWPRADIGIRTGGGLWVMDVDPRSGGDASLLCLEGKYGELRTLTVRTGGGGLHFYFAGDLPTGKVPGYPGLDVKGEGGYVVAPPSMHASGRRYEWLAPDDLPTVPQPTPAWLAHLINPPPPEVTGVQAFRPGSNGPTSARYVAAAIEAEALAVALATEGERNETLNRAAFNLGRFVAAGEADAVAIHDALSAAARHAGLSEREIHLTIRSGLKARHAA